MVERIKGALISLAQQHPGETIAVFTHARAMRVFLETISNKEVPPLLNCSVAHLAYNPLRESNFRFEQILHLISPAAIQDH